MGQRPEPPKKKEVVEDPTFKDLFMGAHKMKDRVQHAEPDYQKKVDEMYMARTSGNT